MSLPPPYTKKTNIHYNPNPKLCIFPTDNESQYEAFQAIIADIMYANFPPETSESKMSAYELLCQINDIKLITPTPTQNDKKKYDKIIYFSGKATTHYKGFRNKTILDPYYFYQAEKTQGFCQLFAYFLVMEETNGFKLVDQTRKIDVENFNKLAHNTQLCAKKFLELLDTNSLIKERFKMYFEYNVKQPKYIKKHGIKEGTSCDTFLSDFENINDDLNNVKHYIYDQPLKGGNDKSDLWFSYMIQDSHGYFVRRDRQEDTSHSLSHSRSRSHSRSLEREGEGIKSRRIKRKSKKHPNSIKKKKNNKHKKKN